MAVIVIVDRSGDLKISWGSLASGIDWPFLSFSPRGSCAPIPKTSFSAPVFGQLVESLGEITHGNKRNPWIVAVFVDM